MHPPLEAKSIVELGESLHSKICFSLNGDSFVLLGISFYFTKCKSVYTNTYKGMLSSLNALGNLLKNQLVSLAFLANNRDETTREREGKREAVL